MKSVLISTLGCKVNQADSEDIAEGYLARGYSSAKKGETPDVCVVNTCTVTAKADSQCRNEIRKLRRTYPKAKIVVTGCYANVAGGELKGMLDDVDIVPTSDLRLPTSARKNQRSEVRSLMKTRTRPQLKVQDGCNNFCAYCIVPYARGRSRSVPPDEVAARVKELAEAGHEEIVLTGIHLGGYGADLNPGTGLLELLRLICHPETALGGRRISRTQLSSGDPSSSAQDDTCVRLRLSSVDPDEFSPELIKFLATACAEGLICPHFHVPLQSGDDEILKKMGRKYSTQQYRELVGKLIAMIPEPGSQKSEVRNRKPGVGSQTSDLRLPTSSASVAIGADVIVGFPGETRESFERTRRFIESLPLAYLHVFPYSSRPKTSAARLKETVTPAEKRRRVKVLMDISKKKREQFYKNQVGRELNVVIEHKRDKKTGRLKGISENYVQVLVEGEDDIMGERCRVLITEVDQKSEVRGQRSEVGYPTSDLRFLTSLKTI